MTKPVKKTSDDQIAFLERIKAEWLATIDALVDPLMIIDQDYTIRKANRALAEISDRQVKDVIGQKCHKIFAGLDKPCAGCKLKQNQKKENNQFHLENIHGKKFFEVTSQPIEIEGERSVVHIYRDRTEHRKMANQLLQKEKLASIGLLAGGIAHELNNPIGGILVFSQMLLMELDKEASYYDDIKEIEEAAKRCRDIVRSLLDFARKSPSEDDGTLVETDIRDVCQKALKFARLGFKSKKIKITEDWHDDQTFVLADGNKLMQVVLNLLQNAEQAIGDVPGEIHISTHCDLAADMVHISVQDSGAGIEKEHIKKIFDPFFTTKDPGSGTGLGLSICYNIIEEISGHIEVESEKEKGTKFIVKIPIREKNQKSA